MENKNNCWFCKYRIQGKGSVICCHPEGEQKYIYPTLADKCIIDKWHPVENENDEEQMKEVAEEVGWIKDNNGHWDYYKPNR